MIHTYFKHKQIETPKTKTIIKGLIKLLITFFLGRGVGVCSFCNTLVGSYLTVIEKKYLKITRKYLKESYLRKLLEVPENLY